MPVPMGEHHCRTDFPCPGRAQHGAGVVTAPWGHSAEVARLDKAMLGLREGDGAPQVAPRPRERWGLVGTLHTAPEHMPGCNQK